MGISTNNTIRFTALALSLSLTTLPALARPPAESIRQLMTDTAGRATVRLDPVTGFARFINLQQARLPVMAAPSAADSAAAFFNEYGDAFGISDSDNELNYIAGSEDGFGQMHLSYQQIYQGIPVFAGIIKTHHDADNRLTTVNGIFIAQPAVDTVPTISAGQAAANAIAAVAAAYSEADAIADTLAAVDSRLYIFQAGLVRGTPGRVHLVYEITVTDPALSVREFVYVDAHDGKIVDRISGIHHALDRKVSETDLLNVIWQDSSGDPDPIPAAWAGGTVQQVTDWQNEIDGALETYNMFASISAGSYLSYDGADAIMRTVNNDPGISCPNASWNGVSTNYCTDVTGDDTVAHEWGHAYIEFTSKLIYQWQSGALNESYSDIWGEVVDLLNGRGLDVPNTLRSSGSCSSFGNGNPATDNSYRWLAGEDDPAFGGAIRDMWNPTCYNHPGKVSDNQYFCAPDASPQNDSGGVHLNSGVPNHAFALMVDGGSYNGQTISGLGLTKAAHIHWAAQNMLTPASNFADHADALEAACDALSGNNLPALSTSTTGAGLSGQMIDAADCAEVVKINDAVEMRMEPVQCGFTTMLDPNAPPLCESPAQVASLLSEDWENGTLAPGWSVSRHDVTNAATFDTPDWSVVDNLPNGANGSYAAFAPDLVIGDCGADDETGAIALDSPMLTIPAGAPAPRVAFDHWVATETGWDGGNVKISVNGGAWTLLPAAAFTFNAYNASLNGPPMNTNPLATQAAFTGTDGGSNNGSWGQSQLDLTGRAVAGDTIQLRFDFGVDGCNGLTGWYIDTVDVYACTTIEPGNVIFSDQFE